MQNVTIDRDKYIGGSDIPSILGMEYFKSYFDIVREKAGLGSVEFDGNKYTEYGNELEPKIRNYINFERDTEFIEDKKINGDLRCHVDGFNGSEILEIKTTSNIKENVNDYQEYLAQLLFYMKEFGVKKGTLAVYERPSDFNTTFKPSELHLYDININDYEDELKAIERALKAFRNDVAFLANNPNAEEKDLPSRNNLVAFAEKAIELETKLIALKEIEKEAKEARTELKKAMEKQGIKTWEFGTTKITLVPDGEDKTENKFNEKLFKSENEELYSKYLEPKLKKGRSGYVKITLREA